MGFDVAFALVVTLAAGIRPLDNADPWTGEELASSFVIPRSVVDQTDPWNGTMIATTGILHTLDESDPWHVSF
jgi:hypothetical protein